MKASGLVCAATWVSLPALLLALGCAGHDLGNSSEGEAVRDSKSELYIDSNATLWYDAPTPNTVNACWNGVFEANGRVVNGVLQGVWNLAPGTFATEKSWIEAAIQEQWGAKSGLTIIFHESCPSLEPHFVPMVLYTVGSIEAVGGGTAGGMGGRLVESLFQGADPVYQVRIGIFSADPLSERGIKNVAVHEFGHVLGIAHEHERPDRTNVCDANLPTSSGTVVTAYYDEDSIENFCRDVDDDGRTDAYTEDWNEVLSYWDTAGVQAVYGFDKKSTSDYCTNGRLYSGFLNADGRKDLLCNDTVTGTMTLRYATRAGDFPSEASRDLPMLNFCTASTDWLFVVDADGDGIDDLVCINNVSGKIFVDRQSNGFGVGVWSKTRNFCPNGLLYTGRFNGDARADILCNDFGGTLSVDLANQFGEYWSDDWSQAGRNFCLAEGDRLLIGDANGDGLDDLICNGKNSGTLAVDYSDGGRFSGTDWSRQKNFCKGTHQELVTLDINADARTDLLCRDLDSGAVQIMLASPAGTWNQIHVQGAFGKWRADVLNCTRVMPGDYDGDGRDDLLCKGRFGHAHSLTYSGFPTE